MTTGLSAVDVTVRHGGVAALAGVDFAVAPGEIVGVIGPNGAGKTTLLDCLSGHTSPSAGRVMMDGVDVTAMGPARRARVGVGRTFQDALLFPTMSVVSTLLLALEPSPVVPALLGLPRWRAGERRRLAAASVLAQAWGLGPYLDQAVGELSTGARRMVDLACVMARRPRVVLLDEPSAGLGTAEATALVPLLGERFELSGAGVVLVEHDRPLVRGLASRIVVMEGGKVVADGAPDEGPPTP